MAQRRMFSKTITSSSSFLMMPPTSRLLYYDLGMNADDDGFCEHYTVMKMTDAKPDDLRVLQAKGFIKVFDEKVLIILDWKENNYLRSDRYSQSKYAEIYKEELKELSSGRPLVYQMDTVGIPNGDTGKVRLGKVIKESIKKSSSKVQAVAANATTPTNQPKRLLTKSSLKEKKPLDFNQLRLLLTDQQVVEFAEKYRVPKKEVVAVWESMLYSRISNGKPYKNWVLALHNWLGPMVRDGRIKQIKTWEERILEENPGARII